MWMDSLNVFTVGSDAVCCVFADNIGAMTHAPFFLQNLSTHSIPKTCPFFAETNRIVRYLGEVLLGLSSLAAIRRCFPLSEVSSYGCIFWFWILGQGRVGVLHVFELEKWRVSRWAVNCEKFFKIFQNNTTV